jgi:DNA-binding transcriptional ArsR family regulator
MSLQTAEAPPKGAPTHTIRAIPCRSLPAGDSTKPRPGLTGEQFVAKLKRVRRSSNGWECRCPAHDDRTPSLSVADGVEGVVFFCHAGCAPEDVLKAMDLEWWQLFYRSEFEYKRAHEALTAQVFGVPVHSGRFSVEKGIEGWRERRRSFAHRLKSHLPDLDWQLLDTALSYETPDEGITVAQGKLGAQLGYTQSTASRRLAPAVEAGLLKSEARSRKGRFAVTAGPGRTSNRYRLDTNRIALLLKAVKTKAKEVGARTLRHSPHVDEMASALITLTRLEAFLYPKDTLEKAGACKIYRRLTLPATFQPRNDGSTYAGAVLRGEVHIGKGRPTSDRDLGPDQDRARAKALLHLSETHP